MSIARLGLAFPTIAMLCLMSGCADRERLNPIDPLNPKTGGKPVGLHAVSIRDTVGLAWQPMGLRDLSGYRIYRQASTGSSFTLIDSVAGKQQSYREFGLTFGRHYIYRITAYTAVNESSPSDTVGVTPGPSFLWIADGGIGTVYKYSHDGRSELARVRDFIRPRYLQANPKTGEIWVIDTSTRELRRIDANGSSSSIRIALQSPVDLAIDSTENSVWVADEAAGVFKYNADGGLVAQAQVVGVKSVAFNYRTRELWALNRQQKQLLRIDSNGAVTPENLTLVSPQAISIHRGTGDAWIADSTRIVIRRGTGEIQEASGHTFSYASEVAVNQNSGECWAVDKAIKSPPSRIVKLSVSGNALFSLNDFYLPGGLSVNVFDGSCFIAEPQLSGVVHVSASGNIVSWAMNFSRPYDVDVDNRPLN
jgi:DNA-binding beta-propeller fold protein YncE